MNHIEAFLSDDAKRGRVWTDGVDNFKRVGDLLFFQEDRCASWQPHDTQVAAMEGAVTWADEPKTLTPQEALRALADGKCVQSSRFIYRLVDREICAFNPGRTPVWFPTTYFYRECHVVPDPSQPAEPQVEYPLTYAEAEALARRGAHVTNEMFPHVTYAVIDSVPRLRTNKGGWFGDDWVTTRSEEVAKWRIVDGGK